jgi:MerR family transcriptional regulator, redox-sensitive transcriptional activator SoxR
MWGLSIGDVAREAGLATSAIRFYEKSGLLPQPPRISGQRRYSPEIHQRIALIQIALDAGFSIVETRTFLTGFDAATKPSARWRSLATRKLAEVEASIERAQRMKLLLETRFQCECLTIQDCERRIASRSCKETRPLE